MKFLSFILNGESKFGICNEKTVTDLTNKINSASTLKELISKKSIQEAKKYAKILGYNYNSSEWFEQSYKVLNKDYKIKEKVEIKKDSNFFKKIFKKFK